MPLVIKVFSKKDCHLCSEAKETLKKFERLYPAVVEEVDIETDPELYRMYRYEIPVIFLEGRKLFNFKVNEEKLHQELKAAVKNHGRHRGHEA